MPLAEPAEKGRRQNTGGRRQETGEGLKVGRSEGFEESRIRRSEGFEESRIQGVKWFSWNLFSKPKEARVFRVKLSLSCISADSLKTISNFYPLSNVTNSIALSDMKSLSTIYLIS